MRGWGKAGLVWWTRLIAREVKMSANRHHADRWFTFGLGVVGAATGYLVALSSSPVVGVVLPLVFGLAGGAGGAYIAKADLNSEHGQRRLALIGKSVGALSLAMIVASMLTLLARTETGRQAFIKFPGVEQLNAKSLVTLATLRARLQVLGASEEEQKGILVRAVKVNTAKRMSQRLSRRSFTQLPMRVRVCWINSKTQLDLRGRMRIPKRNWKTL